jgi:pyruvate kinase
MKNSKNIHIKRQTKIVATIGPATHEVEMLKKLISAGLSVARLNMSHGDHKEHGVRIKNIRSASLESKMPVGVLVDLSGPKIRTGELESATVNLVPGKKLVLTTEIVAGNAERMSVNYPNLAKELKVGGMVMLDDGRRKLEVLKIDGNEIICKILIGGEIKPRRGVNLPGAYLSISAITEKDKEDLKFAIKHKAEYIALSFVRTAEDVKYLKSLLPKNYKPLIISKIETEEALKEIDGILSESDGVMIARGDLAIEIPREDVPVVQKQIIRKARVMRKIVITATQMLETMINNPVPTRAEVSDIANAIFDGTDAVMLSEESAMGKYPVEAVEMMAQIARATDLSLRPRIDEIKFEKKEDALKKQAVMLATEVGAKAIISLTETGSTPMKLASFKGTRSVIAVTDSEEVASKLTLVRGVWPLIHKGVKDFDELRKMIKDLVKVEGIAEKGDTVVVVSGMTFGVTGASNMLFVEYI